MLCEGYIRPADTAVEQTDNNMSVLILSTFIDKKYISREGCQTGCSCDLLSSKIMLSFCKNATVSW